METFINKLAFGLTGEYKKMGQSYKTIITKDGRKIIRGDFIKADVLEADEIYAKEGIEANVIKAGKIRSRGRISARDIEAGSIKTKEDLHLFGNLEADKVTVKRKYDFIVLCCITLSELRLRDESYASPQRLSR